MMVWPNTLTEQMITCRINETILGINCGLEALEGDPLGYCILHSRKEDKDRAYFEKFIEEKLSNEDYNFSFIFFPAPVSFQGKRFTKFVTFSNANFTDSADFMGVIFENGGSFSWTTFAGEVNFYMAKILKERIIFDSINRNGKPLSWKVVFSELWLEKEKSLIFRNLSLGRAVFSGTDLRRVEFHNVAWHDLQGRQAVCDEIRLRQRLKDYGRRFRSLALKHGRRAARRLLEEAKEGEPRQVSQDDYARVEELYQGLKQNYEKVGDYKRVGDFHYGEMEMHRRASPWRRWISWYSLLLGRERLRRAAPQGLYLAAAAHSGLGGPGVGAGDQPGRSPGPGQLWEDPLLYLGEGPLAASGMAQGHNLAGKIFRQPQRPAPPRPGGVIHPGLAEPTGAAALINYEILRCAQNDKYGITERS
jgi:uncharacterized protein YjbI with pentapeptide repeats